jgi:hypothetical protein
VLGAALRPDPKGWEYDMQPLPYEVDILEPEDTGEGGTSSPEEWILANVSLTGNTWEPKYGKKPLFRATY